MCQGSRGRRDINEHVRNSELDKQYDAELFFFFSLYMYLSYIFYFKESTIITTTTTTTTKIQKAKQIQKKKEYRNVEGKSLPVVFDYVPPISQLTRSFQYLFTYYYIFSSSVSEKQKSLLFVFKVNIQI